MLHLQKYNHGLAIFAVVRTGFHFGRLFKKENLVLYSRVIYFGYLLTYLGTFILYRGLFVFLTALTIACKIIVAIVNTDLQK